MFVEYTPKDKERSTDRILIMKVIDGQEAKNSSGMVDKRLFTGGNRLHCVMDEATTFWSFRFDHGLIPPPLRQNYTSFRLALEAAKGYYERRGVEIVEVID